MTTNKKSRSWGFIIYPNDKETNPYWKDCLYSTHLKGFISPLHDKDKWNEYDISRKKEYCLENNIKVGDLKKEHHHVLITYSNTTTDKHILELLHESGIKNVNYVEPINSVIGNWDYAIHKFNIDKEQYDINNIITFNGFNISDYTDLSSIETLNIKKWLIEFIKDNNIMSYDELVNYLIQAEFNDELNICMNNTLFFTSYLKSRFTRHTSKFKESNYNTSGNNKK